MSWAVVDLETTIKSGYGRKADPFNPENWVVMMGWCTKTDPTPRGRRYSQYRQGDLTDDFISLLASGIRLLVGQNIKFDILHIISDDDRALDAWMKYVAGGGMVWDTQIAEYILQGQEQGSHMLSMDDLAVFYGEDTKVDEVKLLWEAGVPTEEIDPDLLARYLLGEDLKNPISGAVTGRREGDIGNTRNIFLKQVARVKAAGQSRVVMINMGSLIATIEMERNGLRVDKELGLTMAVELESQLAAAKAELEQYLPAGLPFAFNWSNRYHLSPLIFGGFVNYDAYEWDLAEGGVTNTEPAKGKGVYVQKDETHFVLEDGTTMNQLWWEHCYHTEHGFADDENKTRATFKGGKNAGEFKTKKVKVNDYDNPKGRACKLRFHFDGYTKPEKQWESATAGLYSVAAEVLDELTQYTDVPFLKKLGEVIAISKNLGTYFITTDEKTGEQKGMLTMVRDNGIVNHSLNHTSTVTGRFSASKPNFQNLPKGQKSRVKELFVSRFPNGLIGQSDFSSLEVYAQAILTGCRQLISDLKGGLDLHCVRLAAKEHMEYEDVLKLCKGWTSPDGSYNPAIDEWDYKRTGAKVYSFQVAYGAGDKTIAKATGMAVEEVAALRAAESARYPEIDVFFNKLEQRIVDAAQPIAQFVNHPCNPLVKVQLRMSRVAAPCGTLYTFRSHPSMEFMFKKGILQSFSPTERKNFIVQGTGALWMKAAMWLMVRAWYARRNFDGRSLLVNTVHDAAYFDSDASNAERSAELMQACMEGASILIEQYLNWPIPLPVPSDTVLGANMGEENPCRWEGFRSNVDTFKAQLTATYLNNHTPSWL